MTKANRCDVCEEELAPIFEEQERLSTCQSCEEQLWEEERAESYGDL